MSLKNKKQAIEGIRSRQRTVGGKVYPLFYTYLGTNAVTGKEVRLAASSRESLLADIEDFYRAYRQSGDFATVLTAAQIIDAQNALRMLSDAHLTISLTECVQRELARSTAVSCVSKTIQSAYDEFLASKADQSADEIGKVETIVGKWVMRHGPERLVGEVTAADIVEYLKTHFGTLKPRTYNAALNYIGTFFRWCLKPVRRYAAEDPTATLEKRQVSWEKPRYMPPHEVERLMRLLEEPATFAKHPEYLALAVTQLFVGTRRVEALRAKDTDAATILLEDETFRVDKGKGFTKNKAPRTAHMEPNAVAWMKSFDYFGALAKVGKNTTQNLYNFARANGVAVFQNFMRHTFITMHVAKFHTPEVTQSMVGTSGNMRATHYDGLAPQKEGEAYFAIYPTSRTA